MVTKRPHFVPRTYLRAWADSDEQVAYRRRDADKAATPNISRVAVTGGIYGEGQLGEAREQAFKQLEDEWAELRDELITQRDLNGDRRKLLAVFMAVQLMRTLKHSNSVNFISAVAATTDERPIPQEAVRQFLRDLDKAEPDDNEVEAAWTYIRAAPGIPTRDLAFSVSMDVALREIAPRLQARTWTVRKFRKPTLMTNDCPVHAWRRPTEDPRVGGIGIENADEVRFPLTPGALLVMTRLGEAAGNASARTVNAEICRQCHQFVVASPEAKPTLDELALPKRPPRLRFRLGGGYALAPDGTDEYLGEVFHMYVD